MPQLGDDGNSVNALRGPRGQVSAGGIVRVFPGIALGINSLDKLDLALFTGKRGRRAGNSKGRVVLTMTRMPIPRPRLLMLVAPPPSE